MALLLAGIVRLLDVLVAGTLDRLLRAIDDQRLGFLPADARLAFHAEQRFRELLDALDCPADRAFVNIVEKTNEFLGDVAPVVDQHDQQVILQPAGLPRTAGFGLAGLDPGPRAAELAQHPVERGDTDPGQALETGAAPQPGGGEHGRHRRNTLAAKPPLPFRRGWHHHRQTHRGYGQSYHQQRNVETFATGLV